MSPWRARSSPGTALRRQHERETPVKLKGLGRGLDALLDKDGEGGPVSERQATLRIDQVQRGRYQPRTKMDERSEEHTSELQSPCNLVCRLLLEKKKTIYALV